MNVVNHPGIIKLQIYDVILVIWTYCFFSGYSIASHPRCFFRPDDLLLVQWSVMELNCHMTIVMWIKERASVIGYPNVLASYEELNFIFHVQLLICLQMHWFFHTLTIVVQSGQIFLTYFRFCKTNLHVFFFLMISGHPVDNLLCDLNWINLDKRWKIQLLQVVFKCLRNDAPSYLLSQFMFTSTIHSRNTCSQASNMLVMPSFKIKPGKRTFHYRESSVWNSIPVDYRCNLSSMKLDSLKSLVTW